MRKLTFLIAFLIVFARASPGWCPPMAPSVSKIPDCSGLILPFQICQDSDTGELKVGNSVGSVPAGSQQTVYDNGICTTTKTINANNGARQKVTLGGNCAITITTPTLSAYVFLKIIQHTGVHYNITWTGAKWASGLVPVITGMDAAEDVVSCYLDTEGVYCQFSQDFH